MRTIALSAASLLVSAAAWACPACYGAGDNTPITSLQQLADYIAAGCGSPILAPFSKEPRP